MKAYIYRFMDGTKCAVEVSDELYKELERLDKDEYNNWQRENRRHVSLEMLVENSVEPTVTDAYFTDELFGAIQSENVQTALESLSEKQRNLLSKVVLEKMSFRKIAKEMNVSKEAIRQQYSVILRKMQEIFDETLPKYPLS